MNIQQQLSAAVVQHSAQILDYVSRGFSVREAFDKVMGEGAHEKLVSDLYDAIRAKHA